MSEVETAQGGNNRDEDEDCPLCLEPLPPFWDTARRVVTPCCGRSTCKNCDDKEDEFLERARAEGTFGRQEEQLASTCPHCRSNMPDSDNVGRMILDRFEKGQLPLNLYNMLGAYLVNGSGGVQENVERGTEILVLGANKGDPTCQCLLGYRYKRGDGLPKSTAEAKRWYLAAIEQGHAIAENNLASLFRDEGNDAEYLRCLRGSASKGYDGACYNLGLAYYNGDCGAQKSSEEAIRVLTPAAERGDTDCMGFLGDIICSHDDQWQIDSPDFTRGVQWLRRAAEKGDEDAISNLRELEEYASTECFGCDEEAPPAKSFLRCSRCRAAWYCSKDCQVQHWKATERGHKQCCIKWESE